MLHIILGTHNAKKLRELRMLIPQDSLQLSSLADLEQQSINVLEVEETGETFQENARLKAVQQAQHLGQWVLGEDSGLSVTALDGRPGVYSARYSGVEGEGRDHANNTLLLEELQDVPMEKRNAFYTSQLCLADPQGNVVLEATGRCHGRIAMQRVGQGGFGYDPLFIVDEYHKTFGEMGDAVKSAISHRSRALYAFLPQLLQLAQKQK